MAQKTLLGGLHLLSKGLLTPMDVQYLWKGSNAPTVWVPFGGLKVLKDLKKGTSLLKPLVSPLIIEGKRDNDVFL